MSDVTDHASIVQSYAQWAATYDADENRTRDLDAEVTRQMLQSTRVHTIVEAGCGTGKNTTFLASRADHLVALDLTPAMLDVARGKTLAPNAHFLVHDVRDPWPVADGTADLVTFNLVLEHVEHLDVVLGHAARACTRGGTVFITELHPVRQHRGSRAQYAGEDGSTRPIAAFPHHVSDYTAAAAAHGLQLSRLDEWWHDGDERRWPRLLTVQFTKG